MQVDAIPGNLQASNCHNGILVNTPPAYPDDRGAQVSDDQVAEILARTGVNARYPWDLNDLHTALAVAQNSNAQQALGIHREIARGLQGIHALWPIVGEGHWRALLLDTVSNTIFLFDPFGSSGWNRTTSHKAGRIREMLENIPRVGTLQFTVVTLDIRVQADVFQCGVWIMWLILAYHEWRSCVNSMLTFQQYLLQHMEERGISTRRPSDNNAFVAQLRVDLRHHVTDPRSSAEPAVGHFSRRTASVMEPDYFAEAAPHALWKGGLIYSYPSGDGRPPPPPFARGSPATACIARRIGCFAAQSLKHQQQQQVLDYRLDTTAREAGPPGSGYSGGPA